MMYYGKSEKQGQAMSYATTEALKRLNAEGITKKQSNGNEPINCDTRTGWSMKSHPDTRNPL